MKKIFYTLFIILGLSILISGCSKSIEVEETTTSYSKENKEEPSVEENEAINEELDSTFVSEDDDVDIGELI